MRMNPLVLIISFITIACSHNENDRSSISKDNVVAESLSISTLDTVQIIKEIKKQYAEINSKTATYDKVEKLVYDESAEGAVLMGYYEKKGLKKITGIYYGETGKTLMEYYFNGNDFFFVYAKRFNYEKPIYIESSGNVKSTEESRYYFYKGDLIKWISGDKITLTSSKEFSERDKFFKDDFEKYKKLFTDYVPGKTILNNSDTVRCKYFERCPDTGYIIKGSRDSTGRVIHVNPKNKNVPIEK